MYPNFILKKPYRRTHIIFELRILIRIRTYYMLAALW